jgi:acetylornithine deacetylase/succinyl-diaminopimelate desuccinylase-like protein
VARTSVSPNVFTGGYRSSVIPSEAKARLDVRMVPGGNLDALIAQIRKAINDRPRGDGWVGGRARARRVR